MTEDEARKLGWQHQSSAFAGWWNAMNYIVVRETELSLLDFPHWDLASASDGGMSPADAAAEFLEEMKERGYF